MAYVVFTASNQEIDRRELNSAIVIGRASDCEIPIRDIMMSRAHCRLEPQGKSWILIDLQSRNGTFIEQERIERAILRDGDVLQMGRTRMTFCAGAFEPGREACSKPVRVRPVDPNESFAGTVVGFELLDSGEAAYAPGLPVPRPRPPEPAGYAHDDVRGTLCEFAHSSRNHLEQQTTPSPARVNSPFRSGISLCLQVGTSPQVHDEPICTKNNRRRRSARQELGIGMALWSLGIGCVMTLAFLATRPGPSELASSAKAPPETTESTASPSARPLSAASAGLPLAQADRRDDPAERAPKLVLPRDPAVIIRAVLYGLP